MKWNKVVDKMPNPNEDVLVCFDNGACVVACIEVDEDTDEYRWWTVDHNYILEPTDMWCEIVLPTAEDYNK